MEPFYMKKIDTRGNGGHPALDNLVRVGHSKRKEFAWMPSEETEKLPVLQGTLDLIVLRTLQSMGPQHAYAIATRLQQVSEDLLHLNQGTLYPALVRLEQQGRIKGTWGRTESNREAKFYSITRTGEKALAEETRRWRQMSGLVEKLLSEGA